MNDRFKFRVAIRQEDGSYRMCEVGSLWFMSDKIIVEYGYVADKNHGKVGKAVIDGVNAILEQCTGLKDKDGKLIYEGDIIKVVDGCVHLGKTFEVVGCMIRWEMRDLSNDEYDTLMVGFCVEITGNIHDKEQSK